MPGPSGELCKDCYYIMPPYGEGTLITWGHCCFNPGHISRDVTDWCGQFKPHPESQVGGCNEDNPVTDDSDKQHPLDGPGFKAYCREVREGAEIPADRPVCGDCSYWEQKTGPHGWCVVWDKDKFVVDSCDDSFKPK